VVTRGDNENDEMTAYGKNHKENNDDSIGRKTSTGTSQLRKIRGKKNKDWCTYIGR
jgi:hypothetical protein